MISRSPLEHIHTVIDSRTLGNPNGFCPNDPFFASAQRLHFSLEFVSKLKNKNRERCRARKEDSND